MEETQVNVCVYLHISLLYLYKVKPACKCKQYYVKSSI